MKSDLKQYPFDEGRTFNEISFRIRALRSRTYRFKNGGKKLAVYEKGFRGRTGTGVAASTLSNWENGFTKPLESTLEKLCSIINKNFVGIRNLSVTHFMDQTDIRHLYEALNIDPERIEANLFTQWAQHELAVCGGCAFESFAEAKTYAQRMTGVYEVVRTRLEPPDSTSELLALAVYDPVPVTRNSSNKYYIVPCRLTVANRGNQEPHLFSYRGLVVKLEHGVEWSFFQEGTSNLDRIRMFTKEGGLRKPNSHSGKLLTLSERPHFDLLLANVELRRIGGLQRQEDIDKFLKTTPKPRYGSS